ncbi:FixH family protein [Afipia sp. DC4300-2b1]|uniref:FixH family protein n=1 Tax=Afipia sp. DC4300-2b1 TaxID=2804672 RepID=UPI003CEE2D41
MNSSTTAGKPLTGRAVLVMFVAFFGVVIGVNLLMMRFAIDTMSGTDVDSAYRASLAYEREIQTAHEQDTRRWRVEAHVARGPANSASVRIVARDSKGAPLTGLDFSARLERPADKRADRTIALTEVETGIYKGSAEEVLAGQWNLVLEGDAGGKRVFRSRNHVMLSD